jgi:hypothetical protein
MSQDQRPERQQNTLYSVEANNTAARPILYPEAGVASHESPGWKEEQEQIAKGGSEDAKAYNTQQQSQTTTLED